MVEMICILPAAAAVLTAALTVAPTMTARINLGRLALQLTSKTATKLSSAIPLRVTDLVLARANHPNAKVAALWATSATIQSVKASMIIKNSAAAKTFHMSVRPNQ
jgi:hypothetical protein